MTTTTSTTTGTGVTRDDLERKFRELQGDLSETAASARSTLATVGAAVAVGVVVLAFLVGRRRGKHKRTIVEIRRL
ncbi:MAG: hypothetical protein AB7L84_14105 [Acidimicrobiia bacterium]